jgi:hypothetical protein
MKTTKAAAPQTIADVKFAKAVAPKPVPAASVPKKKAKVHIKELRRPTFQTMFTRLDLEKEEKRSSTKKGKGDNGHHH